MTASWVGTGIGLDFGAGIVGVLNRPKKNSIESEIVSKIEAAANFPLPSRFLAKASPFSLAWSTPSVDQAGLTSAIIDEPMPTITIRPRERAAASFINSP